MPSMLRESEEQRERERERGREREGERESSVNRPRWESPTLATNQLSHKPVTPIEFPFGEIRRGVSGSKIGVFGETAERQERVLFLNERATRVEGPSHTRACWVRSSVQGGLM